jgi:hypothetical protein
VLLGRGRRRALHHSAGNRRILDCG